MLNYAREYHEHRYRWVRRMPLGRLRAILREEPEGRAIRAQSRWLRAKARAIDARRAT